MKNYALDILNKCIDEIKNTTDQEFIKNKERLGLTNKIYDPTNYVNEDIEIIMPKYKNTEIEHKIIEDSMTFKISLQENEMIWDDNFYPVEYKETTNNDALAA